MPDVTAKSPVFPIPHKSQEKMYVYSTDLLEIQEEMRDLVAEGWTAGFISQYPRGTKMMRWAGDIEPAKPGAFVVRLTRHADDLTENEWEVNYKDGNGWHYTTEHVTRQRMSKWYSSDALDVLIEDVRRERGGTLEAVEMMFRRNPNCEPV
jgi:hypothetical protein